MSPNELPRSTPDAYGPTCLCGHVEAHHATVDFLMGVRTPYCQWRGCGCPRFLLASPPDSAPERER